LQSEVEVKTESIANTFAQILKPQIFLVMRKLAIVLLSVGLLSCSKESELVMTDVNQANEVQLSITDAFIVGEVDGNGVVSITYNMAELEELCACGVSENSATGLSIIDEPGIGYYLSGQGSSTGSTTSFKVALTLDGSDIYWEDGAHIAMCQTSSSIPCDVVVAGVENFSCDNGTAGECNDDEIGGGSGLGYPSCEDTDWPWAVKNKNNN